MTINLSDRAILEPIVITGEKRYINEATRDVLTFVFSEGHSIDELDGIFTAENCEDIVITSDDGEENVYSDYVIRVEISKKAVKKEDGSRENRVFVSMAQRSEAEKQAIEMQAFYDAVMEEVGV